MDYQVEDWHKVKEEMKPLLPLHWQEIALNKDKIPLDPWWDNYDRLADAGILHIVTARERGKIVGYHWSLVMPHLHYFSSKTAFTDIFYILPEYRRGRNGINLFKFVEKHWRTLGVQKAYTTVKVHLDIGKVLERQGWSKSEYTFTKYLGD